MIVNSSNCPAALIPGRKENKKPTFPRAQLLLTHFKWEVLLGELARPALPMVDWVRSQISIASYFRNHSDAFQYYYLTPVFIQK